MKQSKMIFQLTAMHSTHYGAKERYAVEFVKQCRQKGYACILQYESLPASREYVRDLRANGGDLVVFSTLENPVMALLRIVRFIISNRPWIIETHFVSKYVRGALPWLARAAGVGATIAFVRNIPVRRDRGMRRFLYNGYTHVFGVSKAISAYLVACSKVNPKKVSAHYWGVLGMDKHSPALGVTFRKELNIPDPDVVIGVIGFDTRFKGLDVLLAAFARLAREQDNLRLLIIGVEPATSHLSRQADSLGIQDRVHWAGIRDQGWRLLNAVDIYVQPSRDSEGFGVAIVEAMALKLPAVGTKVGGVPEVIRDGVTGFLAEPDDVESLGEQLRRLIVDPVKRQSMGRAGCQRYRELFDGKQSVKRLVEYYSKLKL